IQGTLHPRKGEDGQPYGMGFDLSLPDEWNGRFAFQGGGGIDGFLAPAVGMLTGTGPTPLERGFATAASDGGHRDNGKPGEGGNFGFDQQARKDYAYNALDTTILNSKKAVEKYYGKPISKSYFFGCSNGGRQGMLLSQRFPKHFDGIVAGAPGFHLIELHFASISRGIAMQPYAPVESGQVRLDKAIDAADLKLVGNAVLKQCDAQDGVTDGIVSNTQACHFDVDTLACKSGASTECLTPAKLAVVKAAVAPVTTSKGQVLYPEMAFDTGIGESFWKASRFPASLPLVAKPQNVAFFQPPAPELDPFTFNMDEALARTKDMRAWANADSTDLSAFEKAGGKLLLYHGISDQIMTAKDTVQYYEALAKREGGFNNAAEHTRLFLVPGMLHCAMGPGTDDFDLVKTITEWVEGGKAPERIVAKNEKLWPGRTRPLCPYPTYAHYKGNGDPEKAENFECRTPAKK
ncbi:MAG: tannase/feruloyl esterase family alpha/beta hydrolase, partial [Steroidobacteraceae bacterium]